MAVTDTEKLSRIGADFPALRRNGLYELFNSQLSSMQGWCVVWPSYRVATVAGPGSGPVPVATAAAGDD